MTKRRVKRQPVTGRLAAQLANRFKGRAPWCARSLHVNALTETLLGLFVGSVFCFSGISKSKHPRAFVLTILDYRMLPRALGMAFGRLLLPLEVFLAVQLLAGVMVRAAAIGLGTLLVTFIVAVAANIIRGLELPCGCFGLRHNRTVGWGLLVEDLALLAMTLILVLLSTGWVSPAPWSAFRPFGTGVMVVLGWVAACAVATAVAVGWLPWRVETRRRARGVYGVGSHTITVKGGH